MFTLGEKFRLHVRTKQREVNIEGKKVCRLENIEYALQTENQTTAGGRLKKHDVNWPNFIKK
jgi:hypothetical protein